MLTVSEMQQMQTIEELSPPPNVGGEEKSFVERRESVGKQKAAMMQGVNMGLIAQ